MRRPPDDPIRRSRKLLENPYAYLDGEGGYAVVSVSGVRDVHDARRILENQYAYLDEHGGYSEWHSHQGNTDPVAPLIDRVTLLHGKARGQSFSRPELQAIARSLHIELWRRRAEVWPARREISSLDVVDPSAALRSIGYSVEVAESLGQYSGIGEVFEVAGIFDDSTSEVQISRRFSPEIRNFTTAHELGHAILHTGSGLHRDRALDGSGSAAHRDSKEAEADTFAAYFLLPEKLVGEAFEQRFLTRRFAMNDDTAFALTSKNVDDLRNRCRTIRDLTRVLATAEYYNGVHFYSIAKQFRVSAEAMAIRLEELRLVER